MVTAGPHPPGYPEHRAVHVPLRDGSTVRIRPVLAPDLPRLVDLFGRLSRGSTRMRFHAAAHPTEESLRRFAEVDYRGSFSLVAETGIDERRSVIALASYFRTTPGRAEMALVVDDDHQGRGLGSVLIEHLGEAAAEAAITTFEAEVLAANADMLEIIHNLDLPVQTSQEDGVVHAEFPTSPTPEAIESFERREAVSAAAGVARFLKPRSVAVIGASRRRGTISGEVFRNLIDGGFEGPVYPVNPKAGVVQSVRAYPSVLDVPGDVDLAVIVVPAPAVSPVARECGEKGVKALLVISAGFAETDEEGEARQRELLEIARGYGMRIVGPNCMGLMNTHDDVRLNASFAPHAPAAGRLGFSSQSGALGIAVIDRTRELGLGMSSFVSVGNKADISGNDLLQFWETDECTDVILLYLESFGNPRKFARIARRVSRRKPIVAVKSGRSQAGARAAASHTGSLAAGDVAVDALFHQAGVIRTDTLEELFDVASLLANQPLPNGAGVGILTNAGGLGILCADACEASGLAVPDPAPETKAALRELLPQEASVGNPVDMIASATAEQYARSLELLAADPNVETVIVIFIPPLVTKAEDVAAALAQTAAAIRDKTVIACFLGVHGIHRQLRTGDLVVPSFAFPEAAARALGRVARYASWRRRPEGSVPELPDVDRAEAVHLAASMLEGGERWLEQSAVQRLLGHYGIPTARTMLVSSAEEVEAAAASVGCPVAIKIDSRTIVHKTDVGGVRLGLETPSEAAAAAREIEASLREQGLADRLDGFLVQQMVTQEGAELFVGVTHDPLFGPLLACGYGGTLVELMRDVAVRITPVTETDVDEMLQSLRAWPLFEGYRGQPPLDREAVRSLLFRVSAMVEDLPHIAELDLNPVLVGHAGAGAIALDARIRLTHPTPARPLGARTT
ncbi:MAG TPA: GNAT family N-acetyltransferase [Actinomycetota bacterium]|nr:GNAT family N-acetyltransferase [Actinomycetota bacterium]